VVLKDVPEGVTVVGIPAQVAISRSKQEDAFCAYGTPAGDMPDPVARALDGLLQEVTALKARVVELEGSAPTMAKQASNGRGHAASRDGN
jgi:serine O-acetyltransferase